MPARLTIRRLQIRGLMPRDHAAPAEQEQRLKDVVRSLLPEALKQAVRAWSGEAVLRIRRLEVDIALDAAFEPSTFATSLASAIAYELLHAEASGASRGGTSGIVYYESRAIYLAALLEALAEGRAADQWWLRDAEGLRFLSRPQAIRTALLADAKVGLEALASLPPLRRAAVLHALTPREADRVLDGFAHMAVPAAGLEDCTGALAAATAELPEGASALAVFVGAFAERPGLVGPSLAAAARLWVKIEQSLRSGAYVGAPDELPDEFVRSLLESVAGAPGATILTLGDAHRMVAAAAVLRSPSASTETVCYFTQFGGLLLLLPELGLTDIAKITADWADAPPDAVALIAYAALGLCAGRERFGDWLDDALWRELFGLDARAPAAAVTARLVAIPPVVWATFRPLLAPMDRRREARFLLAPRQLTGSRDATHTLVGLARAVLNRFTRHLPGFGGASAPFVWENLLATTAAFKRGADGWSAWLSRPPLDVLLSLARIAEGSVQAPSGARIEFTRVSP